VCDSEVADAVHARYFGTPSLEQEARRQAFEALQERLESVAPPERLEPFNERGKIA
jgi:hypothetical protein